LSDPVKGHKSKKKIEYDRRILNSTNRMKASWNLINLERGEGKNNQTIQSISIDGETTTDHQSNADTFNKHFVRIPDIINKNNIDKNYSVETYRNNEPHYTQMHLILPFPRMKSKCTTEKEIISIIISLKPSNSSDYDEITTTIL